MRYAHRNVVFFCVVDAVRAHDPEYPLPLSARGEFEFKSELVAIELDELPVAIDFDARALSIDKALLSAGKAAVVAIVDVGAAFDAANSLLNLPATHQILTRHFRSGIVTSALSKLPRYSPSRNRVCVLSLLRRNQSYRRGEFRVLV